MRNKGRELGGRALLSGSLLGPDGGWGGGLRELNKGRAVSEVGERGTWAAMYHLPWEWGKVSFYLEKKEENRE